jgi:predicted RNase H-like HicB family nuclease
LFEVADDEWRPALYTTVEQPLTENRAPAAAASRSCGSGERSMKSTKFTYWQDGDYYLGFMNDYPDYQTQGLSEEELAANLKDLLADLESGEVLYVRKVEEC